MIDGSLYILYYDNSCFFFQAEDGIRDWSVTGVQTCALPISNLQPLLGCKSFEPLADRQASARAVDKRLHQRCGLAGVKVEQHGLDRTDRGRGKRERAVADRDQCERPDRF